jgi:hypothetical protein
MTVKQKWCKLIQITRNCQLRNCQIANEKNILKRNVGENDLNSRKILFQYLRRQKEQIHERRHHTVYLVHRHQTGASQ